MNSASKHPKKIPVSYISQLHVLLHSMNTHIWYLSDDHTYGMINKAHADFNGIRFEDAAFSKIPENILSAWQKIFTKAFSSTEPIHTEELVQNSSGEHQLLAITLSPGLREDGSVEYVVCSAEDITERKQAEEALRMAEEKFRAMYDNAPLPYQSLDCDGCFLDVNPNWLKTLGYLREKVIGKNFADFLHPDSKEQFKISFPVFKKLGILNNAELKIRHKNGNYLHIIFNGCIGYNTDGSFKQTYCVFQDITEKRIAEKAFQNSQMLLRNIFENSTNLYYSHTTDHILTYMSPQVEEMLGYTREEAMVLWMELASDNPINEIGFENTVRAIETGERQPPYELELVRKDGKKIWVEIREFPEVVSGKTIAMLGSLTEITERRRAEEELKSSEEQFRTIFENSGTATGLFGEDGILLDCNAVLVELCGYSRDEIIYRMSWTDFVASEDLKRLQKYHSERTKKGFSPPAQYECRLVAKSGKLLDVLVNIAVNGETRIVSLVNITDRKKAYLEIQRMQRLEGLGTIAGGIAHDFNNLLTGIFANLEMAKMDLPENSSSGHYLQEAHHSILSARRLTGQLLTFAKGGTPVFKIVDMTRLIQETIEFNLHGSNVNPEIKLQDNLWSIMADEGQIEQVLANLTINSKQAMPGGGTLHVEGRNLSISEAFTEADLASDSVLFTIRDEGIGIPPKIINHIFDPYFSTKETGHGLGLAIVYSIIKQHNGLISVTSEPNTGTTFTIILPAVPEAGRENVHKAERNQGKTGVKSSFHILLMDDEEIVRDVGTQLLERLGHTADTANHGDEAIKKYTEAMKAGNPFDLVIMDLTIRDGKGGKKTIEELLKIYPEAKVIVSSGYSSGPIMANFSSYGFSGKLAKPFMAADLQNAIVTVMRSR